MSKPIANRTFVSYIDKSREYYAAHGYEQPYKWVSFDDVPFTPLGKPLSECTVGLATTAAVDPEQKLKTFVAPVDPRPTEMITEHLHWHQSATTTDDLGSFLPFDHLQAQVDAGRIGAMSTRFYGTPTLYSQRRTDKNAAEIAQWCREDDVDLLLITPL